MVQCSRVILYPVMNIIHYEFQFILQNAYYTDNKVNELFSVIKGKKLTVWYIEKQGKT